MIIDQNFIEKRPLSYSSLKEFRKSPKHYIQYLTKPFEQTDDMIIGQAIECKILEPEKFDNKFVFEDKPDLRSTKNKEYWNGLIEQAKQNNQLILPSAKSEVIDSCVESLLNHEHAKLFIDGKTDVQIKLNWRNTQTNLPLIGYADFESIVDGQKFIIDLKCFYNGDPDKFAFFVNDRQMYLQAGMYANAYHKKFYQFPDFIFMLVETQPPYNVTLQYCDNKFMEIANEELIGTLKAFRKCMDENLFHMGYEFRLFGTKNYFRADIPKYYSPKFSDFDN